MAHVPWIPLHTSWPRHRKTMRLRSLLGTAEPILWLWCWAAENATNGDLSGFSVSEIEDAAGWKGESGKAFKALCDAGFIDVSDDVSANKVILHEWQDTAGSKISAYLRRNQKQRDIMRKKRSGSGSPDRREEEVRGKSNSTPLALTDCGQLLPNTPERLKCCLDSAMQKRRPERCPYAPGNWWDREAATLLRDLGDVDAVAPEILRRIVLFVADDRMAPWTVKKFCQEYNGIGTPKIVAGGHSQGQAIYDHHSR